jgi:hypothetical protein
MAEHYAEQEADIDHAHYMVDHLEMLLAF